MQMGQLSHLAHFSHLHNTAQCSQTKHLWLQPWEGLGKAWALRWRSPFSTARKRHFFFHLSNSFHCKRAQEHSDCCGCPVQASFFHHALLGLSWTRPRSPQQFNPGVKTFLTCLRWLNFPSTWQLYSEEDESNISIQHTQTEIKGWGNSNDSRREAQSVFSSCPGKKAFLQPQKHDWTPNHYQVWQTKFAFRIRYSK